MGRRGAARAARKAGGADDTSLEDSALLYERHHTKVHHGFRVERRATTTEEGLP